MSLPSIVSRMIPGHKHSNPLVNKNRGDMSCIQAYNWVSKAHAHCGSRGQGSKSRIFARVQIPDKLITYSYGTWCDCDIYTTTWLNIMTSQLIANFDDFGFGFYSHVGALTYNLDIYVIGAGSQICFCEFVQIFNTEWHHAVQWTEFPVVQWSLLRLMWSCQWS